MKCHKSLGLVDHVIVAFFLLVEKNTKLTTINVILTKNKHEKKNQFQWENVNWNRADIQQNQR